MCLQITVRLLVLRRDYSTEKLNKLKKNGIDQGAQFFCSTKPDEAKGGIGEIIRSFSK